MPKLNRNGIKSRRKENVKNIRPGNYLIVTEGTKTEYNYFNNIKRIIERLFRNEIIVDKISSPSKMNPCTTVQNLVEELVECTKPNFK